MKEKTLIVISLLGSLAGLFALFLFSEHLDYNERTIEKINSEKIEEMIKITGEVVSSRSAGNVTFITITQPSEMDIVVFNGDLAFSQGEKIEVIGKREEYNGKVEIIGQRIRVVG